jgi:transcriptional regulator with XRE-family HTH domain
MPRRLLNLKATIVAQGRTQRDVAEKVHVSPKTFSLVVSGRTEPWPLLRRRLEAELGVPEAVLFACETSS